MTSGFPRGPGLFFFIWIVCWFQRIATWLSSLCRTPMTQNRKHAMLNASWSRIKPSSRRFLKKLIHQSDAWRRRMLHQASMRWFAMLFPYMKQVSLDSAASAPLKTVKKVCSSSNLEISVPRSHRHLKGLPPNCFYKYPSNTWQ